MPQFTPGASLIAKNRRKFLDPSKKLEKLRDIPEEDVVRLMGHRAPGEAYKSIHPPIEEMEEPDCAVRQAVKPTPGTAAGDRIRYVQFTDSMQFAPTIPRIRPMMWYNRYRGIDPGMLSGRSIVEARERDLEKLAKENIDNETYDAARTGLRGRTVHGHSVRLDERGMMFDALRRYTFDARTGNVKYVKDMVGGAMDKEVMLGKPLPDADLKKRTTMFRNAQGGVWMEGEDPEVADVISEIHWNRTWGGFQPFVKRESIKGNKGVGVKGMKLYTPKGGVE